MLFAFSCALIKGFVAATNHMACIDPAGGTYSAAIVHKAKASAGNEKYRAQRKLLLQSDIILLAGT